jgi:hypothetical protein
MSFTARQYDIAIEALRLAKQQLEPDCRPCTVCGDTGHQAFECGHNPLLAMLICTQIAALSHSLHKQLHYLAGFDFRMGVQVGPAKVVVPPDDPNWVPRDDGAFP